MPLLVSRFIVAYGWRTSYMIVAAITLVPTLLGAQFMRRDPSKMGQLPDGADKAEMEGKMLETAGFSLLEAVRTGQFWLFSGVTASSAFSMGVVMIHIVAHATDIGMSVTSAANILAFMGGLGIAGRIIGGSAADRIGAKRGLAIIFIMHSAALFFLVGAKEPWMLYLFGAVLGFGLGGFVPAHSIMIANLFGLGSHGVLMGVTMLSVTIGLGIGSFFAGKIFDIMGNYSLAFLAGGVAMVIALILTVLLKPTRKTGEANDA